MRIALLSTSWPANDADPSGHFVRSHARELEQSGHRVTVLTPSPGGAFGWPGVVARMRQRPHRSVEAARWVHQARRQLRRLDVDRVIAHWAIPCAWPIALGVDVPVDVVSHGGDVRLLAGLPRIARLLLTAHLVRRASTWTFVSDALLRQLLACLDRRTCAHVERIARVRAPPIEIPDVTDAISGVKSRLGGARVAVSAGRLVASKRVDRAIAFVADERSFDVLVIVGDGPERPRLERLARTCGVNAKFVGALGRPEALAWIGAATALLHASEAEGLSTTVREAQALGVPVVRLA
jgi:teichuronic acid biosynthesis glycosyltransferase TuaC